MISARPTWKTTPRGLTLIELTVVIAILAMLMVIALPAVSQVVAQARTDESKAIIRQLEAACLEFEEEIGFLPYSRKPEDTPDWADGSWTGSQLLRLQLTGYGPDDQDDGVPGSGDNPQLIGMDTDDGNESFGFRRLARGQIYGPYHGVEEVSFVNQDNDRTAFIDAFANEIFYYSGHDGFKSDDNGFTLTFDGQTFDIESYAEKPGGHGRYWRSDFLIFSAGADGLIEPFVPGDDTPTDDVTNFLPES